MKNFKNLFFVLLISFFFISCSKGTLFNPSPMTPQQPQAPQEWEADVQASFSTIGIIQKNSIVRVGSFQVINPNSQTQSSQMIYSLEVSFKNYENVIDTVYWKIGTLTGIDSVKGEYTFTLNQTLSNGQKTTPLEFWIKRNNKTVSTPKLVEIAVEKISARFKGNNEEIIPYSQKQNIISFSVN